MKTTSKDAPPTLAAMIKAARDSAGMTQAQLAALLGCTVRSVNAWEAGRVPSTPRLMRLVASLDLDVGAATAAASL